MASYLENSGQTAILSGLNGSIVFSKNGISKLVDSGAIYYQLLYTDIPQVFLAKIYKQDNIQYVYRIDSRTINYSVTQIEVNHDIIIGYDVIDNNFEYYSTHIDTNNRFYINHPGFSSPVYVGQWQQGRSYFYSLVIDTNTFRVYYSYTNNTEQIYFDEYLLKDFIPPVIGLITPNTSIGYQYTYSAVNLIFDITDNETVSSAYITYRPTSGGAWTSASLVPSAYSGYYGSSALLPYDTYQATVYAVDNTEIETTRDISFIVLDPYVNTAPSLSITSPLYSAGYSYSSNNISLRANIVDNRQITSSYIVYKEIASSAWYTGSMSIYDTNSYKLDMVLPYGSYQADVYAYDDEGEYSTKHISFSVVDVTPPAPSGNILRSVLNTPGTPYYHYYHQRYELY